MSQEVICKNCQFGNPHGSKFCSNCGDKLPLSTHILCPNCSTSNQIDRIFCDNCGTRLVKGSPIKEEDPKKEDPKTGPQAFSLPTRRPGETGELSPNLLPEWLRTGEHNTIDGASSDEDTSSDDAEDKPRITTDELTKIDDLRTETSLTDELPDWLMDQIDSDPIIPEPAGITTELYLDLVNNPDLPEVEDEVTRIEDDDPFGADSANLPDWLSDANAALGPEDDDEPDTAVDEHEQIDDSDLDVLAGLTEMLAEQTDKLVPPSESGIGLTDWLTEPEPESDSPSEDDLEDGSGLTDWLSEPSFAEAPKTDAPAQQGSGLTEILNDPDPYLDSDLATDSPADGFDDMLSEPEEGAAQANANEGAGLTDWLTNLDELESPEESGDDWLGELSGDDDEETGVSDWLDGLNQLTESQMNIETSSEEEDDSDDDDWFASFSESQDAAKVDEPPQKQESLSVTDWLSDTDGLERFEEQFARDDQEEDGEETAVSDAIDDLFNDDYPSDDGHIPDWLGAEPAEEQAEENTAQSELDWMFETGGVDLPNDSQESESLNFDEPDSLDGANSDDNNGFDWLSDLEDIRTGSLEVPEYQEPEQQEEIAEEDPAEEEWVSPMQLEEPDAEDEFSWENQEPASDSSADEEEYNGALPDWMTELGPPVGQQAPEPPPTIESEPDDIESELPGWLTQLRPDEEGLIGSSLPSALNPDIADNALNLPDIPLDIGKADLPDWLSNESGELPDVFEETVQDVPEWLNDSDALTTKGDSRTEWDSSLLDKLPPPKSEPQLAQANIPDWLAKFKPQELQSDEPELASNSGLANLDSELGEATVAGVSDIIKIEPSILPSTPVASPTSLAITPAQTKQIEILRQLLDDNTDVEQADDGEGKLHLPNIWNLIIILLMFFTVSIFWVAPGLLPFALSTPELANNEAFGMLEALSNETVIVAFEHTPAMAGELNYQNQTILDVLEAQGNKIIPVTQHATTVGVMANYTQFNQDEVVFLPGEAIGLRLLGDCLNGDNLACRSMPVLETVAGEDVALIVLITSEQDALVNWIEQISGVTQTPMIVSTTFALAPMAAPYELSGQIEGVMTHAELAAQRIPAGETRTRLIQQANASASAQLLAIVLFLISLVMFGFKRPERKNQGGRLPS